MNAMSDIAALEEQAVERQKYVENRRIAQRLFSNRDFKKLILEEFCVNECARYAQNSANPALGPDERADSLAIAQAAGHLRRFLSVTIQMGNQAEVEIRQINEAIEEIRAEGEPVGDNTDGFQDALQ